MSAADQLYLVAGKYVSALDARGEIMDEFALSEAGQCLAVTPDNEILVGLRDHVECFDRKGSRRATWETPGRKAWLTSIAVSANHAFVADAGHRLIWKYDRSGKLVGRFGEKDRARNIPGFIVPSPFFDVELSRDGLLRVTNPGRHRVEGYTVDGDFEFAWGKPSGAIEGFCGCCNPINLALLSDGRYVTCEKGLPRVKVYRETGELESVVAGPESFPENVKACSGGPGSDCTKGGLDAVVDSAGKVYILDLASRDVRIMARRPVAPAAEDGRPDASSS
jgi:hypothetical protein